MSKLLQESEDKAIRSMLTDLASQDFPAFLEYMYPQVEGQEYVIEEFHAYMAELIQDVFDGLRSPNQSVSVPPQHGKSRLISVRMVAWVVGAFPGISVAMTGFSFSLLDEFLTEVKDIVATKKYQTVFPGVRPKFGRNRSGAVAFSNGSMVKVSSARSKLTGRRVDLLIVDDPHEGREEAENKKKRDRVRRWFFADCLSRISPDAKIFIVATRWHPDDLHGAVTDEDNEEVLRQAGMEDALFEVTNFPAVATRDNDELGRKEGDPLCPVNRPVNFLERMRLQMPVYEWMSQFMGDPQPSGAGQVDVTKIKRIGWDDVPDDIQFLRGWDLAVTETSTSDYTAGALLGWDKRERNLYLLDIYRKRMKWTKGKGVIVSKAHEDLELYGSNVMAMEAVAGFKASLEDIRELLRGYVRVKECNPKRGGKLVRAQPWLDLVEEGHFYVLKDVKWYKNFVDELTLFPDVDHDDQVDAVSIAYEGLVLNKKSTLLYA